jgi:hypothetical protein
MGISFVSFTALAFIVLRLGLRWPFRRVLLASVIVGLVADLLLDLLATRPN